MLEMSRSMEENFAAESARHALVLAAAGRARLLLTLPVSASSAIYHRSSIICYWSTRLAHTNHRHINTKTNTETFAGSGEKTRSFGEKTRSSIISNQKTLHAFPKFVRPTKTEKN